MEIILPITFRFNSSLEYEVSKEEIDFYTKLSSEIFKTQFNLPKDKHFKSISVTEEAMDLRPRILTELFKKEIDNKYRESFSNDNNEMFIIDLSRCKGVKPLYPLISDELLPLLEKLIEVLSNPIEFETPKLFILVETLYEKESFLIFLKKFIKCGAVCILGFNKDKGVYYWKNQHFQKVNNFKNKILALKSAPEELIKYKLIRKVGHFKRDFNNKHSACQQFFYNGEFCRNEVFELLTENILKGVKNGKFNPDYIVFYCPNSSWLKDSVIRCSNELTLFKKTNTALNINGCFDLKDISEVFADECQILLVVDLINSGTTFTEALQNKLLKYFPKAIFKGFSVLCTDHAVKSSHKIQHNKTIKKTVSGYAGQILIDYLIQVEQLYFDVSDKQVKCPMCKHDLLELVDISYDGDLTLSSYEMWLISNLAGYTEEIVDSTAKRVLRPELPDTIKLIEKYGPLLAYKFNQNIKQLFPDIEKRPKVIIFPDETSNNKLKKKLRRLGKIPELSDTPSGFYANCLKELLGFEILGIPRKIISELESGKISTNDLSEKYKEFSHKIQNLPANFILIDEFFLSGFTLDSILAILRQYGKTPSCFFPIINYGLKTLTKKQESGHYNNIIIKSFYEFNLNTNE